jgi:hypothetical protein
MSQFVCIKLNIGLRLQGDIIKLFCARARAQRVIASGGEDSTMSDNNFTAHDRVKYQQERDLQRRGVKIHDALRGITDDDRKTMINSSLRKVGSSLNVS